MLEAMTLLTASLECVSPITLANCCRKAGVGSESQARSQADDDGLFKLFVVQFEEFQDRCESPIDFTVDDYVVADEVNFSLKVHLLTDYEIIALVAKTPLDVAEHKDKNEENDTDLKMSPPKRDQVHQAIEVLQS